MGGRSMLNRLSALPALVGRVFAWRQRACAGWTPRLEEKSGQSLTELALIMPLCMITIAVAADMGLALREQTTLTQRVQQAAEHVMHHPADATAGWFASYLSTLGPDTINAGEVSISYQAVGLDPSTNQPTAQQAIIRIAHPFPLVAPVGKVFKLASIQGNTVSLGTNASIIAATQAPASFTVASGSSSTSPSGNACSSGTVYGGYTDTVTWTRPVEADGSALPATLPLYYRLYESQYGLPYSLVFTSSLPSVAADGCFIDHAGGSGTLYRMDVMEPNGLASTATATVTAP